MKHNALVIPDSQEEALLQVLLVVAELVNKYGVMYQINLEAYRRRDWAILLAEHEKLSKHPNLSGYVRVGTLWALAQHLLQQLQAGQSQLVLKK